MNEFLNMYKKGGATLASSAFDCLIGDLLIKEKRGPEKSREITAMNMESDSPKDFVPSMIYTFLYVSDKEEEAKTIKFKDNVPVILCFSSNASTVTGLNFNLIPNDARASILDLIVKLTKFQPIKDGNKFEANKTMVKLCSVENGVSSFIKAIEIETGLNVSGAVRTYNLKFVKRLRMIEYDMWKYIPALSFKDSIRGAGLADIQANLIKSNR